METNIQPATQINQTISNESKENHSMNTAVETKNEAAPIEAKEAPKMSTKASAIVAKEVAKAAYDTERDVNAKAILGKHIATLQNELKELEDRQALYRRVIGPHARSLLQHWNLSLESDTRGFVAHLARQHEDNKTPYLDFSYPGAFAYFNKELIKAELPALAFAVVGTKVLREVSRSDPGFYPVVPRIIEIRAELEELGVADKSK